MKNGLRSLAAAFLAAVTIAASMLAGATSAGATGGADQARRDTGQPVSVITFPGTPARAGQGPDALCPITVYGRRGTRICEFAYGYIDWGGGNLEWFVVGSNYAVWHIWRGVNWQSLGGQARRATPNGAYPLVSPRTGVATIGTDNRRWCRFGRMTSYTPWAHC